MAVALAEPEADADAQWLINPYNTVAGVPVVNTFGVKHVVKPVVYNQVPVVNSVVKPVVYKHMPVYNPIVKPVVYNQMPVVSQFVKPVVYKQVAPVVPVVKYVDPHHTEGMAVGGVPEKTDSVKIAEKQHEVAKVIADAAAHVQHVAPYTSYAGVYPYAHQVAGVYPYAHQVAHVVAKREADSESEADPYVLNNLVYNGAPYPTANAGYPYTGIQLLWTTKPHM